MHDTTTFSLQPADQSVYAKYFATYRKNIWFRPSWRNVQDMMLQASDCYWVMRDQRRIAGISLADHALGSAFVIPPFSVSEELVRFLTEYCLCMAGNLRRVEAYNVLPEQLSAYESAGFGKRSARKCMIRPTERLALPDVPGFVRVHPEERKHLRAIVELKKAAYRGGLD